MPSRQKIEEEMGPIFNENHHDDNSVIVEHVGDEIISGEEVHFYLIFLAFDTYHIFFRLLLWMKNLPLKRIEIILPFEDDCILHQYSYIKKKKIPIHCNRK